MPLVVDERGCCRLEQLLLEVVPPHVHPTCQFTMTANRPNAPQMCAWCEPGVPEFRHMLAQMRHARAAVDETATSGT